MEIEDREKVRISHFVVTVVLLVGIVVGTGVLIAMATQAGSVTEDVVMRRLLGRMAIVLFVLLALALLLLLSSVMRFYRARHMRLPRTRTPYVDAWALAGKRFKLENEQSESELDEQSEQEDEQEGG
ncbi:MAG: hypothetical protein ACYSTL_02365 [Planctomycetota bacterium]|jgi:uncharacterized protein HemY